jgi:hypothetical protein
MSCNAFTCTYDVCPCVRPACRLQYLTHALELKESYKLLKPHVEGLLMQVGYYVLESWVQGPGLRARTCMYE